MSKPRVFIGSSSEGLRIARSVQTSLYDDAEVVVWENDVFNLSVGTLEAIWTALENSDFGVFVLTEDDVLESRGHEYKAPRDNVIFELGVFMGRLGRQRAFWLMPKSREIKVPTDLMGVTAARYDTNYATNISAMLAPACDQIRSAIRGTMPERVLTWNEVTKGIANLASQIKRSPSLGGFPVDAVIGLSGGGAVVSDLLAKTYGGTVISTTLSVDRRTSPVGFYSGLQDLTWLKQLRVRGTTPNVLVVDDISRSGSTLSAAMDFFQEHLQSVNLRSAALAAVPTNSYKPDYYAISLSDAQVLTPFQV